MRSAILALLASGAISAGCSSPAAAFEYPYCIQSQKDGTLCEYSSYNQCMATASGRGVECIVNPIVAFAAQNQEIQPPQRSRHRHRHHD
jgi:nitrous oxide reductase accessory protein NosL